MAIRAIAKTMIFPTALDMNLLHRLGPLPGRDLVDDAGLAVDVD